MIGNNLIAIGTIIILIGILFNIFTKFHILLLPGDILVQKENFTLYFPIVTSIILSIVLTIIFRLFRN